MKMLSRSTLAHIVMDEKRVYGKKMVDMGLMEEGWKH